jgi:hypothetical protein
VEARHGFVPLSGEMAASRVRRRYRLTKGGHPFLVLIHYSRGQSIRQYFISLSISLMVLTHPFHLCDSTSRPAPSASPASSTVPVAPA